MKIRTMEKFFRNYVYPVAMLSGSIIGVGFLSLPYIALQVGIFRMLFYMAILSALVLFVHLIFGEISLKTPDFKRFPGFVGFYLGEWAQNVSLVLMIFGSVGVLLAYLIIGGQFLTSVFSPIFGGGELVYALIYFSAVSAVIYFDIKIISKIEFWAIVFLIVILSSVFVASFGDIKLSNIFASNFKFGAENLFLPYGPILFSLWGVGLIPEMEEMLKGKKKFLKKNIIIGTLIPTIIYVLFIFLILGITGFKTTDSALTGLKAVFGDKMASLALFVGVLTTFSAFIAQGLLLKKIFIYDMNVRKTVSWVLTCFSPLALFLLGVKSFIPLISFVGGVFLGINGIFIMMMHRKIGGSKASAYLLSAIFILGIAYEIYYFIR